MFTQDLDPRFTLHVVCPVKTLKYTSLYHSKTQLFLGCMQKSLAKALMPIRSRYHALGPFLRYCDLCQVLPSFISAIMREAAGFSEVSVHCYRILGLASQKRG